jgi:aspartyl-tRNA(Asn)/glutamyl-tRNA(Gln) amidotransferase subunit B
MRTKEDAPDYRYFPDPDLVEIEFDKEFIQEIEANMPELPEQRLVRLTERFGIPIRDAERLIKDKSVSDFFESCASHCDNTKTLNRWITRDLFRLLNDSGLTMEQCPIRPIEFSQLINLIEGGDITNNIGKTVLEEMFKTGKDPAAIIEQNDLKPIDDTAFLEKILDEVERENPDAVTLIRRGETKPIDYLIGQVMRKTQGKAHAKRVRKLVQKLLAP